MLLALALLARWCLRARTYVLARTAHDRLSDNLERALDRQKRCAPHHYQKACHGMAYAHMCNKKLYMAPSVFHEGPGHLVMAFGHNRFIIMCLHNLDTVIVCVLLTLSMLLEIVAFTIAFALARAFAIAIIAHGG